jgi:hypothetical protein
LIVCHHLTHLFYFVVVVLVVVGGGGVVRTYTTTVNPRTSREREMDQSTSTNRLAERATTARDVSVAMSSLHNIIIIIL